MNPAPKRRARILVVDDHHVVRSGLAASLGLEDDLNVVARLDDRRNERPRSQPSPRHLAFAEPFYVCFEAAGRNFEPGD